MRSGYTNTLTDGLTGSFSTTVYFEATDVNIYLRNVGAGVTDITSLSAKEVGQDWTLGTGWSIGSSLASCDGTQTAGTQLTQNGTYTINKIYKITYTVIVTAGNVDIRLQGSGATVTGTTQTTSGAYTEYLTSTGNTAFALRGDANFIGSIDNVSVKEITDDTNLPRINYSGFSFDGSGNIIPNSGCGAWLFEPQTTQLVPYSEALTSGSWSTSGGSTPIFEGGYLAPDGTNTAFKVSNANKNSSLFYGTIVLSTSLRSIYARTISGTGTAQLLSHNSNTNNTFTITEQWQRFDVNSANSTGDTNFYAVDFRGSGTLSEIILWGANATNDQDYATSYIPTEGTIKTRNQDLCNNGGDASLINSTEGVLYVEIAALANDGAFRLLGFSDGTSANRIYIGYSSVNNITCSVQVSSSTVYDFNLTADITINSKLALKYKGNDFAVWVNGVEVDSQSSGNTFPVGTLTQMQFTSAASSSPFYGKTKALAVWKEALTDAELTALTTI